MERLTTLNNLNQKVKKCKKCSRLALYVRRIAKQKTRRFRDEKYWGRPLPGFGDLNAEMLLLGLAPAAHGGNRTGRMFTGDSSGDWVAKVLYQNGFATKPTSERIDDGFKLINTYITAAVKCAPPQNKPLKEEFENCSVYLRGELNILKNIKVIVCLGKIAFDSCCKELHITGKKFSHGNLFYHDKYAIMCSYHPSRQNTQTGRLTWRQWSNVFTMAKGILGELR